MSTGMGDMVNSPAHYTNGPTHSTCGQPIECIDIVDAMTMTIGSAMQYLWRHQLKGEPIQDLRKAIFYIQREIDRLSKLEQMPKVEHGPVTRWTDA